jgi:hypothetical protein
LIPGAVEVAEEQEIVVLNFFLHLAVAEKRKSSSRQDHPSRELDEGQVNYVLPQALEMPQQEENAAHNPRLPWLHGSDGIHRIDFAVDVAHCTSDVGGRKIPPGLARLDGNLK